MSGFVFKNGDRVVFIGDSITDCGRRDAFPPYGNGYVKMAIDLIIARYPEKKVTFYNKGISGNTVEDLRNRWYDDVMALKPDWVSVKIGINDLHHFLRDPAYGVPPDRFRKLYNDILTQTKDKLNANLIIIEPFYISNDSHSGTFRKEVLKLIPEYLEVVRDMAKNFGAILVPTHDVFRNHLKYKPADYFAPEPVHPYPNGHLILAHELLKKIKW